MDVAKFKRCDVATQRRDVATQRRDVTEKASVNLCTLMIPWPRNPPHL